MAQYTLNANVDEFLTNLTSDLDHIDIANCWRILTNFNEFFRTPHTSVCIGQNWTNLTSLVVVQLRGDPPAERLISCVNLPAEHRFQQH